MDNQLIVPVIYAKPGGFANDAPPAYLRTRVLEIPCTLVSGSRTFVAINSGGVVVAHGILAPGGDMSGLVTDLSVALRAFDPMPALQLVAN